MKVTCGNNFSAFSYTIEKLKWKEENFLVHIMSNQEQILEKSFGRRGYSLEECKKILESRRGDVTYIKQRSFRKTCLKDVGEVRNC